MKIKASMKAAAIGGIALLALTSCAANEGGTGGGSDSALSGTLVGSGASSQGAAQTAWTAGFQKANDGVTITYSPDGSGAGRESFQQGAVAFAGSDRAFTADEVAAGPFESCSTGGIVEVPAYISPIAVVFNLDGVTSLNMDADTIAKIFSGKIKKWNDEAIASQNPDVELPDLALSAVHRADKSGTTGNFTEYLAAAAPDSWTVGSIEEWPSELGGEGANQTSGLIDAVTNGKGTIGYADSSKVGDLGTVKVKVGSDYVEHSAEGAAAVVDASPVEEGRAANDIAITLDRTSTEAGVYPIVLVSYLIGCEQYKDAANAELVKAYFGYIVSEEGQQAAAKDAGSAPISSALREKVATAIDAIK